ncbi:MAG TPA: peptidoglycan DD-metalloendopeptidase family protein [Microbacteriaceae bacterium]|nr:peptidoglycan DD-metalloendopeptidase family protein [Microbacteriaceae bacterium]
MRRRSKAAIGAVIVAFAAALIVPTTVAYAADYPSWQDVENARSNEQAKQNEIANIQAWLQQLRAEVERTKADLEIKAQKWQQLNTLYEAKVAEAAQLRQQAEAADAIALESERRAGQWAAQVVRIGGSDPTLSLFAASDKADDLLSAIGVSSRISAQANTLYEEAIQQRNTAQGLTDQATVMEEELGVLEQQAAVAMQEAQAASEAATAAVIAQQENEARLQQQLIVLTENRAATEADYQIGEQKRIEEELANIGVDLGQVSAGGWIRPAGGFVSAWFGYSASYGGTHSGVDLAQSCWNPIVAAHEGSVSFAGWNSGGYGYLVVIDHGGGLETYYGHMPSGGIEVGVGQYVMVGQKIGNVGTTGNSTGCHLHFEMRANGQRIDPAAFLAAQGIYL